VASFITDGTDTYIVRINYSDSTTTATSHDALVDMKEDILEQDERYIYNLIKLECREGWTFMPHKKPTNIMLKNKPTTILKLGTCLKCHNRQKRRMRLHKRRSI